MFLSSEVLRRNTKSSYGGETRISLSCDFEVVSIVIYASLTRTKNQKCQGAETQMSFTSSKSSRLSKSAGKTFSAGFPNK